RAAGPACPHRPECCPAPKHAADAAAPSAHATPLPPEPPTISLQGSLKGHPHRAHPHDLPVGLQPADVVIAGLPLHRRLILPGERYRAVPADRIDDVVVLHNHHALERVRPP